MSNANLPLFWQSFIAGEHTMRWTLRAASYVVPCCTASFEPVKL